MATITNDLRGRTPLRRGSAAPAGADHRGGIGHFGEAAGQEVPFCIVVSEGQGVTVSLRCFGLVAKAP